MGKSDHVIDEHSFEALVKRLDLILHHDERCTMKLTTWLVHDEPETTLDNNNFL